MVPKSRTAGPDVGFHELTTDDFTRAPSRPAPDTPPMRYTVADMRDWLRDALGEAYDDGRVQELHVKSHPSAPPSHGEWVLRTEAQVFVLRADAGAAEITAVSTSAGLGTPGVGVTEGGTTAREPMTPEGFSCCVAWMFVCSLLHAPGALARRQAELEAGERSRRPQQRYPA